MAKKKEKNPIQLKSIYLHTSNRKQLKQKKTWTIHPIIPEETELDKTDRNKKILLAALEKSLGVVTTACRAVNLSRQQHYHWMEVDPEYKAAVQALSEVAIDFAESKLHKLIENNDTAATIFYLKTKGKKRGYIERVENMIGEVEQPLFGPEDE
jgi:hypothetical protein